MASDKKLLLQSTVPRKVFLTQSNLLSIRLFIEITSGTKIICPKAETKGITEIESIRLKDISI